MADELDDTADRIEKFNTAAVAAVLARPMPVGEPGECRDCGEDSLRLVGGRCAPCRDGR